MIKKISQNILKKITLLEGCNYIVFSTFLNDSNISKFVTQSKTKATTIM